MKHPYAVEKLTKAVHYLDLHGRPIRERLKLVGEELYARHHGMGPREFTERYILILTMLGGPLLHEFDRILNAMSDDAASFAEKSIRELANDVFTLNA